MQFIPSTHPFYLETADELVGAVSRLAAAFRYTIRVDRGRVEAGTVSELAAPSTSAH